MSLPAKCQRCGNRVTVSRGEDGGWRTSPCPCTGSAAPEARTVPPSPLPPRPASGRRGPGRLGGTPSSAVRTGCSCGRSHPSRMQATVCLNLRTEVESTGGWVLHEVGLPLPALGPQPAVRKRKARPVPPGRAFTIRVDFIACWPDGRWRAVEAKDPNRVDPSWKPRAGALRTWYGRDPLFLGLEERKR